VDALVALHQHEGGFRAVDGDAWGGTQVGVRTQLLLGVTGGEGEDQRSGDPRLGQCV